MCIVGELNMSSLETLSEAMISYRPNGYVIVTPEAMQAIAVALGCFPDTEAEVQSCLFIQSERARIQRQETGDC